MDEKIVFVDDSGNEIEFYVIEQTELNGTAYLLVTDSQEEEGECFLFKDVSPKEDPEAVYVPVEDEVELGALSRIFAELLEDVEII